MTVWLLSIAALLPATLAEPRTERLDNGLRVVIVPDGALPLVSVQLWYRVGSAWDDPRRPGLCHVARAIFEHNADADLRLRAAGVRFESGTTPDACYFASLLPPEFLDYVLAVEAGRMRPPELTAEIVAAARDSAARPLGESPEPPDALADRQLLAGLFKGHPYGHPPWLVSPAAGTDRDELAEFVQRWFVPGNATLVVVGPVSDVTTAELVRERFGGLPWAEPPRRAELPALPPESEQLPIALAERPAMVFAWLTPPAAYFENAAIDVLMHRLCNPIDGPLTARLRELGCPPARWYRSAWREHGMLVLTIDLPVAAPSEQGEREAMFARVLEAHRDELARAQDAIPSEIELNRARALAAIDILRGRAAFRHRAATLAWYEVGGGDVRLADYDLPRVLGQNVGDLHRAAAALKNTRMVFQFRLPPSPDLPTTRPAELVTPYQPPPAEKLPGPAALELLARQAAGAPLPSTPPSSPAVIRREVADGVRLVLCRVPGLEPARVETLVTEESWISAAPASAPARFTPAQLDDYLSYHGMDLFDLLVAGRVGLGSSGPGDRAPQMVELQAERVRPRVRPASAAAQGADALDRSGRQGQRPAVEILVAGDVPVDEVEAAARLGWSDVAQPPPSPGGESPHPGPVPTGAGEEREHPGPQGEEQEGEGEQRGLPQFDTRVSWGVETLWPLHVSVLDRLAPAAVDPAERELVLGCVRRLVGVPGELGHELRAGRDWAWIAISGGGPSESWMAHPRAEDLVPTLMHLIERLERIMAGELPLEEVAAALRLARADRLVQLDSAAAIVKLLARGVDNPWDLRPDVDAKRAAELARQIYRPRSRLIIGSGPEDRGPELERFQSGPPPGPR